LITEKAELLARPIPLEQEVLTGHRRPLVPTPVAPQPDPQVDTPRSEKSDPSYFPPIPPNSRRELQPRLESPVKRTRARILPLDARHSAEQIDN